MAEKGPREYALKAIREGRVCVVHARSVPARDAVPHELLARVVGHNGVYSVGFRSGTWSCSCGVEQPCGHRMAVSLVAGHMVPADAAPPSGSCAWCMKPGHHEDDCTERQAVSA